MQQPAKASLHEGASLLSGYLPGRVVSFAPFAFAVRKNRERTGRNESDGTAETIFDLSHDGKAGRVAREFWGLVRAGVSQVDFGRMGA
jgi:hypothetical protein